jgi:hypothetical protein
MPVDGKRRHSHRRQSALSQLAESKGGLLATFDRKLYPAAVKNGRSALHIIEG